LVRYTATASVGGKLGQIGARMLDAASKQMADQFFTRLGKFLSAESVETAAATPGETAKSQRPAEPIYRQQAPSPTSEASRVLWFALGSLATGFGFTLAHFLR
jgi:hypothetical protein